MPIGDIFGILQFTPLAITAAAALFLGARVGWRRWSGDRGRADRRAHHRAAGRRGLQSLRAAGLGSVLCSVARDLLTRGVAQHVPSLVIAWSSATIVTLASLGFTAVRDLELAARPTTV